MDNSQTSSEKKKLPDERIENGEHGNESSGEYYYDDSTGYEPYDGEADDEDEIEHTD